MVKISKRNSGPTNAAKIILPLLLAAGLLGLLQGCPPADYSRTAMISAKRIVAITVEEDASSWICAIWGNQPLTFSVVNQVAPTGVNLYFPNTIVDMTDAGPIALANDVIGAIRTDAYAEDGFTSARVSIGLNIDRPYSISPADNGLKISFPKTLALQVEDDGLSAAADEAGDPSQDIPSADLLTDVTATPLKDNIIIDVSANGTIHEYQSFAIDNPARIVFDIFSIKSLHKTGQTVPVNSKWVRQVRYSPYPDKVRLVLDTEKEFLGKYFSFPTASGLLIYVGRMPQPLDQD